MCDLQEENIGQRKLSEAARFEWMFKVWAYKKIRTKIIPQHGLQ